MFPRITRDIDYAPLKKILSAIMPSQPCDHEKKPRHIFANIISLRIYLMNFINVVLIIIFSQKFAKIYLL